MNHQLTEQERISQYVRDLKISTIRDNLEDAVSTAMEEHWTYQRFLAELLQKEVDTRIENRKIHCTESQRRDILQYGSFIRQFVGNGTGGPKIIADSDMDEYIHQLDIRNEA